MMQVPLLSIFAQAQSLLPDDAGSVSIKPVKSPYVLLDKIAKQIKRDSEQTRGICSLRVDATYNKDGQPQFSASGIYKGRVSVGIDLRRIETVEAPILNGWRCTGRDSANVKTFLGVLAGLSPLGVTSLYETSTEINLDSPSLPSWAISPLQGYDIASKWFNLAADEMRDASGKLTYRLKFSRNDKPRQKHLTRQQEPGDISGTAYFDGETLRLLSFKGCAYMPVRGRETRLQFSSDYDEESGRPLLRQTSFVWKQDAIAIKGTVRRTSSPKNPAAVCCATEVSVENPGSLSDVLTQAQQDTCTQLKVKGALNSADVRLLRQMGGCQPDAGRLCVLDLSEASFVDDKMPYMVLDARAERLAVTAVPGRMRNHEHILGKSATSKAGIDTDRYNNLYWQGPAYFERSGIMLSRYESVSYYHPQMYLGQDGRRPISKTTDVFISSDRVSSPGYSAQRSSDGQYFFADSITSQQWKEMKRRKLTRCAGYELRKERGGYFLYAFTRKGLFPQDMFYKCTHLQTVIPPEGTGIDGTVRDKNSQVRYVTDTDLH